MPSDSPPPLDLRPVRFETQLGELTSPVVIEFEDTSLRVLTIRGRQGEMVKLLMSRAGATPEFLEAPSRLELGDLVVAYLTSRPVRAFALPEGVVAHRFRPGVLLIRAVAGMVFTSLAVFGLGTGIWQTWQGLLAALLFVAVVAGAVPLLARWPALRQMYATGEGRYALDTLLDDRPAARAAVALVDGIKEEYGRLLTDLAYRIETPALFDPADELTRHLTTALIRWDTTHETLDGSELGTLAAEVRVAFEAAKEHAEAVGLRHLPEEAREPAGRALKAARVAAGTDSPGEREAALEQVTGILDSLALYYLPRPSQVRRMLEGRALLALPGRRSVEEGRVEEK